jgi:small subunit ribosomal protein S8
MPTSRLKEGIARILKEEGYISDFHVKKGESFDTLVIQLKYGRSRERIITDLKRVSKPGRRVYARQGSPAARARRMGVAICPRRPAVTAARRRRRESAAKSCASSGNADESNRQTAHRMPRGVNVSLSPGRVMVNGPLGELSQQVPARMKVEQATARSRDAADRARRRSRAARSDANADREHGRGRHEGLREALELQGVGYRAALQGADLRLDVGYSHPVVIKARQGISFEVPDRPRSSSRASTSSRSARSRRDPQGAPARAVQGQGHPLLRASTSPEGREARARWPL